MGNSLHLLRWGDTAPPPPPPDGGAAALSDDDVIREILIRLPIKSLIRSGCACKHWLSLSSDPHLLLRRPAVSGIFLQNSSDVPDTTLFVLLSGDPSDLPSPPLATAFRLQACFRGLMLCSVEPDSDHIVNPLTRKQVLLPPPPRISDETARMVCFGSIDSSGSYHYNIVAVLVRYTSSCGLAVYSSETRVWKRLECSLPSIWNFHPVCVCWNASVNWLYLCEHSMMSFEVEKNMVRWTAGPRREQPPPWLKSYECLNLEGSCGLSRVGVMRMGCLLISASGGWRRIALGGLWFLELELMLSRICALN